MDLDKEDLQTNLFILVLNLKILTENDYMLKKKKIIIFLVDLIL